MKRPEESVGLSKKLMSPDGSHTALLLYAGEIRFGPAYYTVQLDGRILRRRLVWRRYFGDTCLWSAGSRYLALQEWRRLSEKGGPDTQLVVIDVQGLRECAFGRARGGFAAPVRFEGDRLLYAKTFYNSERQAEVESSQVDLSTSTGWQMLWRRGTSSKGE